MAANDITITINGKTYTAASVSRAEAILGGDMTMPEDNITITIKGKTYDVPSLSKLEMLLAGASTGGGGDTDKAEDLTDEQLSKLLSKL